MLNGRSSKGRTMVLRMASNNLHNKGRASSGIAAKVLWRDLTISDAARRLERAKLKRARCIPGTIEMVLESTNRWLLTSLVRFSSTCSRAPTTQQTTEIYHNSQTHQMLNDQAMCTPPATIGSLSNSLLQSIHSTLHPWSVPPSSPPRTQLKTKGTAP